MGVSVMSGYRDRSNFDPNVSSDYGPPMRPYNWVQWTGIGLIALGTLYAIIFLLFPALCLLAYAWVQQWIF